MASLAVVYSRAMAGVAAPLVTIEVQLKGGLPGLQIVGLPETAVKESKERVRTAITNSGLTFPRSKILINLAPADLPKQGGRFDLPIALGILAASKQVPMEVLANYEFAGELALSGVLREIDGVLPLAMATAKAGRQLMLPAMNVNEASLCRALPVFPAQDLLSVHRHLVRGDAIDPAVPVARPPAIAYPDVAEVVGQQHAKYALLVAAAGGHSLLFCGPPGTGKTMLASRLPGILPELDEEEALEVAAVYSITRGGFDIARWRQRAFRAPHHTASGVAMVGGGRPPQPGEVSLAHRGVLFLDELPEFQRSVLEALREPLEAGHINIIRANYRACFPASFQLIAAMNPCPCGYFNDPDRDCRCSPQQIQRYQSKLSGPVVDRIDMQVAVGRLSADVYWQQQRQVGPTSADLRGQVVTARQRQHDRQRRLNASLSHAELIEVCQMGGDEERFLHKAQEKLVLSGRSLVRTMAVARTIADCEGEDIVRCEHLEQALTLRRL